MSAGCVEMGISHCRDARRQASLEGPALGNWALPGWAVGSCGEFLVRVRVAKMSVLVSAGWPGTCVGMW